MKSDCELVVLEREALDQSIVRDAVHQRSDTIVIAFLAVASQQRATADTRNERCHAMKAENRPVEGESGNAAIAGQAVSHRTCAVVAEADLFKRQHSSQRLLGFAGLHALLASSAHESGQQC